MIKIKDKRVLIKKGDITQEDSDAIVNPANDTLQHGGGAAAAIVKSGGIEIQIDSDKLIRNIGLLPTGKAVITYGHNLQAKFIIHTVGPKMGEGNEENKLKKSVLNALNLAESYNLKSISIPAISSGIFGFPKERCAEVLLEVSVQFLSRNDVGLKTIVMCNHDEETYNIFLEKEKYYL
ncbi:MAG: macro domain-containing protein [Clostridium tyrobutyricum]|uniref:macro domain-containing protein n=1 Tax=Clostridium tyrobutyricum TaxID=1519 RepID=UPI00242F147C|nr:macro domain-containing protein [Clostridium tyrobutyricum]MCH4199794.1 macro domain-containing protein [Clostridium tyrobutyricum]MCH4258579.1 macro domain-containing protein [Clostridium tyrobutyricum]MCI1239329.1 macro domain-containing protein [Clostridium tyrobutyricum]MCI1652806.1 macro domain-containing protein [Clostridium tyrobutyricum]MCI1937159.1 macro domain-containing protein [Clostridium tyrobutyricum]